MTKKKYIYLMDLGKNKANMLRDPSSYVNRAPPRKTYKHKGSTFSRNNTEFNEEASKFPITVPINNVLDKLYHNEHLGESIHKIIKVVQSQYLPQIKKLEQLLLNNPTYIYITKILGISKENALRVTGAIATFSIIYIANSILRRHKSMVLDTFIYATPIMSIYEILKKEPELMSEKKKKVRNLMDNKEIVRSEFTKIHELKTWMIYLMICSLFNITDNFFINRSKPVVESSITQTVITTTPYLLRDTNKQVFTTIAQVTPFSERFYNSFSQKVKNTFKYSWYWVLKLGVSYWLGYKDGREIIYNKFVIPLIRKYYEYELKVNNTISEDDISFEDGESFSKSYNYFPSNLPKPSSNTRDHGLQPPENVGVNNNDSIEFYKLRENSSNSINDGYYSDSYYESSEPINLKLNNSGIFNSMKLNNTNNNQRVVQNTDSLSVEDPWKSNSFIGNNASIRRNRSFSLNSINHYNNSLNNYRATIRDNNNRLSEYYNDTGVDKDNNNTFYANSILRSRNQESS
ncbi:hypothetical protein BCR36DRAFT_340770 [Piromyces finnis]|uniref:Uncharacterized protein n=1 Tax=Piromyces finnis TaxID=1754191 RepID=A0A1Y1VN55_9FUNG|nr:hypothetical protein BCR36DRAFT_340770 [Piromyces finnis]|eukprot:ORX60854.1 hypothetical protein BCR36DRAFT_340770 [Piromyces finnis]